MTDILGLLGVEYTNLMLNDKMTVSMSIGISQGYLKNLVELQRVSDT